MKDKNQEWAEMLRDTFEYSFQAMANDVTRLESLQKTYDNVVAPDMWPTVSQIPIAAAWATAEEATGPALEHLFPNQPSIRLIPDDEMDPDARDRVQWAVHLMLNHRMRIKRNCSRSIRDCFKVSVGYGIIEPILVTPPAVFEVRAAGNVAKQMGVGRQVSSLRYRYISPGKIVPYPQGIDFNGDDATPFAFFLDFYPEGQFRAMFSDAQRDGEDASLTGDVDAIVAESKAKGFTSRIGITEFTEAMAGRRIASVSSRTKNIPAMVPILKCYSDNRHTWLFCGSELHIVYDRQNKFETMRKPLIKFDAWMDSDRWFPMSQPEADERITWGKNILYNAVIDIISQNLRRQPIGNAQQIDGLPRMDANIPLMVDGDIRTAFGYADPPSVDAATFNLIDEMDKIHSSITGKKDFTAKNYARGGSMAFQDLKASSTTRDILRHALLQTGGFEDIVYQTVAYMQTIGSGIDLKFQRPAFNQKQNRENIEYFSITDNDLKHVFSVMLDLDAKERKGGMDMQMKIQLYSLKKDNPYIDQHEAAKDLFVDEYEQERQLIPRDEAQRKQREIEAANLAATQAQGQPGPAAPPAVAGAMQGGNV